MTTRRELFNAKKPPAQEGSDLVKSTVNYMFAGDDAKKKGELRKLSADEKMLCALRKVLASMSNEGSGAVRYFIDGAQVRVTSRTDSAGAKKDEPSTYHRRGTCRLGLAHKSGEASYKMASFEISFRDAVDQLGLPDVAYFNPTSIEELPTGTPL